MEIKRSEREDNAPDGLRDPDIEPIMTVLGVFAIPIATAMYQVMASNKRWIEEDRREILGQVDVIQRLLRQAKPAFDLLDEIIQAENLANKEIYPVGVHGVNLSTDASKMVLERVNDIILNLNDIDEACMKLSNLPVPDDLKAPLDKEIAILHVVMEKVYKSKTYGAKLIWLRRSISDARNVLLIVENGLK